MSTEIETHRDPLQQEFLLIGESDGHSITGTEVTFARAMAVARALAVAGWRVRVRSCDPYFADPVCVDVWCEESP